MAHQPELQAADAIRWAEVAARNVRREYPHGLHHTVSGPGDVPAGPRAAHPAFYGCYDWHSAVELHWVLVRLLAVTGDTLGDTAATCREVLGAQLTAAALETETRYVRDHPGWERPYGWAWALVLAHELDCWDDPDAATWAAAVRPLAETIAAGFTAWLPKPAYPVRHGMHSNSAFALSLSLPWATANDPALLAALCDAADRWFGADTAYPARYEPSGADFLSPALTEAELLSRLLDRSEFDAWLDRFLPTDGEDCAALLTPVAVTDPTDGQLAHLHGLNLSRAWCWRRIGEALPTGSPRQPALADAVRRQAAASLPAVSGSDYMVEHWLAAYAVLLLT